MEKIWKKASQNEYESCFNILNTESLIERDTYVKFAITLFEIAKNQLGLKNTKLKFVDNLQNNLGFASVMNNTVTLNLSKMEKQTLYKTVSTIYHELTHIRQFLTDDRKKINTSIPAEFPFIRCHVNEKFLPENILGIDPFLFYYTCQHEKQARDIGSECAMDLFIELKNIAQTKPVKNGTIRLIERCINQVQTRWDTENTNNKIATAKINEFLRKNYNFTHVAFDNIIQEFNNDISKNGITFKERSQYESRFNCRVGALVLLGCDDNLKNQILNFVSNNFVNKSEIFTTLISVVDSPYSKITKNDLSILFNFAEKYNFPKEELFNYLISWDKNYINEVLQNKDNSPKPFKPIDYKK